MAGEPRTSLRELALLFLRLGATAFGGPAAHIAMMEEHVVRRRGWMTPERYLDLIGAANLIPGPNSTEVAIHVGYDRRGLPGLVVAGLCFIVPAMVLTGALGWAYVQYGARPEAAWLMYGIKPVIIAIVVQALWNLGRRAVRSWWLGAIGAASFAAVALGVNELVVLAAAGALAAARVAGARARKPSAAWFGPLLAGGSAAATPFGLAPLFLTFLKIGAVLFGSGYVLLAFLRADFVARLHWLTESQLLDAVAAGQITPGPVFTTATFIGYVLGGPTGALVATAGIFLPAFVFVAISGPLVPRIRRSPVAGGVLDGVNVASLALMAVVAIELGRAALIDAPTIALAVVAAVLLVRFRVGSLWLVALGAAAGVARVLVG
ncbi:MAG TPA: chromate efflux transporter [Kofleriaceae bacterium]|nr:chromate efflux transporter [Kofleriaceae bacterium]